ncbi:MAG: hypothetical protein V4719_08745 [Planctomycetota bacterium]
MISSRNLSLLPDVTRLRAAFRSMAMLDAIIMPEWQFRYYSFESEFSPDGNISIGAMRNGSGDDLHAIFGQSGCLIRGFAHEHAMSPYAETPPKVFPGVLDDIPSEFAECLAAIHSDWWQDITFCIWRRHADLTWSHGSIQFPELRDPDGSEFLLSAYDGRPETYHIWANEYYQHRNFSLAAVRSVFDHRPLTEDLIRELNPDRSLAELTDEVLQIGYGRG